MSKAEKLYDAYCEHLGRGKRGHPHFDDLPHEERIQWGKVAAALDAPIPPPDDPNTGGPPTP